MYIVQVVGHQAVWSLAQCAVWSLCPCVHCASHCTASGCLEPVYIVQVVAHQTQHAQKAPLSLSLTDGDEHNSCLSGGMQSSSLPTPCCALYLGQRHFVPNGANRHVGHSSRAIPELETQGLVEPSVKGVFVILRRIRRTVLV